MSIYLEQKDDLIRLTHIVNNSLKNIVFCDNSPSSGTVYIGQIKHKANTKYWVDIGLCKPALLKKYKQSYTEGELLAVEMLAPPIPEGNLIKNPSVKPVYHSAILHNFKVGHILQSITPKWIEYIKAHKEEPIYTDWPDLRNILHRDISHDIDVFFDLACKWRAEINSFWQCLQDNVVALKAGGYLIVDELDALTVIDVNTTSKGDCNFYSVAKITNDDDYLKIC